MPRVPQRSDVASLTRKATDLLRRRYGPLYVAKAAPAERAGGVTRSDTTLVRFAPPPPSGLPVSASNMLEQCFGAGTVSILELGRIEASQAASIQLLGLSVPGACDS